MSQINEEIYVDDDYNDIEMTPEQEAAFNQAMTILSDAGFNWEMTNDNLWEVSLDH